MKTILSLNFDKEYDSIVLFEITNIYYYMFIYFLLSLIIK